MNQIETMTSIIPEFARFARNLFTSLVIMISIGTAVGTFSTYIGSLLP